MAGQESLKMSPFDLDALDAKDAELCVALMERAVAHKHIAQRAMQDANKALEDAAQRQESFRKMVIEKYGADLAHYRLDGAHCIPLMMQQEVPRE